MAQGAVVGMMLMACGNIFATSNREIHFGAYDWTDLIGTILVALALGYCGVHRNHVRGQFIVARFPQRVQAVVDSIAGILSLASSPWQLGSLWCWAAICGKKVTCL
jgi:TRAP-type mannitol/chloroaromatic compound transport system permease small subunit